MSNAPGRHSTITYAALLAAILCAGLPVHSALALFTDQPRLDANTFTTRNLVAPNGLGASAVGHDVQLSWNAGENGSGYAILGIANGTSSDCAGATFSNLASTAGTSYGDTGRYSPQGSWFCYQVETSYGNWTSSTSNPVAAVRLGFFADSVEIVNDGDHTGCNGTGAQQYGQSGLLDCGDQIIIAFNQAVDTSTGPGSSDTVCADQNSNTIWLASTVTNGNCTSSESVELGTLTGGTIGNCDCRFSASYTWSNGDKTLTVTIGSRTVGTGLPSTSNARWTFTPITASGRLQSATGGFHICDNNGGGGDCLPSTSSTTAAFLPLRAPGISTNSISSAATTTPPASKRRGKKPTPTFTPTLKSLPTHTRMPEPTPTRKPTRTRGATPTPACPPATLTPTPTRAKRRLSPTPTPRPTHIHCSSAFIAGN